LSFNENYLIIHEILSMKRALTLSVQMLRMLIAYASGQGIDTKDLSAAAEPDPPLPDDAGLRISADTFHAVWQEVISQSADSDFGLHFAESMQDISGSHILFVVMMNCPTVGSALEAFCRYHNLMNDAIRPKITQKADLAFLGWEASIPGYIPGRHEAEALLCVLNSAFRRLTEYAVRPEEIRFHHPQPENIGEHARIFQAPLLFRQPMNVIVFEGSLLERPVNLADPELLKTLEGYALTRLHKIYFPDTWADRATQSISKLMQVRRPTIRAVAGDLAVSVRTLQNKLKEEGTSFQELLDLMRKEASLALLKDPAMSLYDVSFLLGFSEQSAFNHAFRRWTGLTPKAYRQDREKR
jgi:AraC-like DNA-binding protein